MTYAIAQARRVSTLSVETARIAIVCSCALALMAAGQILPF